jgi:glycine cleavage system H protein
MKTPAELKYNKTDEWVKPDGNMATIGISDYAQDQLSDIVFLEFLKNPGDDFKKGDILASIESVKAAADIVAPVSGIVKEINASIADAPETLNEDPYEKGWLFIVELSNTDEVASLMDADKYNKYCEGRH